MSPRRLATPTAKSAILTNREHSGSGMVPAIFTELFVLLEEYGPHWYTEDLHDRFARELGEFESKRGFSLIQGRASEKRII